MGKGGLPGHIRPETSAAYALAGRAVAAIQLGVRFGTLALARDFVIAGTPTGSRADHLWKIFYAGPSAEGHFAPRRHNRWETQRSPACRRPHEAVEASVGSIDERTASRMRRDATRILQVPGNAAAVTAVAARLEAGDVLSYFTARQMIRAAIAPAS